VRQIPWAPGRIACEVEGDVGAVDRVLRITEIRVRYRIRVPAGRRDAAERAVATHEQKCPAATSVRGCIPIRIDASIDEDTDS
jgi:organic hydroperoxide reductase OsmC/OhrA